MAVTNTGHHVDNYFKGQGIVSIRMRGEADYRDIGNVPEFEFTPAVEKRDHHSSRTGIRAIDKTFIISQSGTVRLVMEDFTAANLALMILGELGAPVTGMIPIEIFAATELVASVRLVGTNDIGARIVLDLIRVTFNPTSTLSLISSGDDLDQMEIEGTVTRDAAQGFGMLYWNVGDTIPVEPAVIT